MKKLTRANDKVKILGVWFGLGQQEGPRFRGEDQKSEERFVFLKKIKCLGLTGREGDI